MRKRGSQEQGDGVWKTAGLKHLNRPYHIYQQKIISVQITNRVSSRICNHIVPTVRNSKFGAGGQCLFKHRWSGVQHQEIDPFSPIFSPEKNLRNRIKSQGERMVVIMWEIRSSPIVQSLKEAVFLRPDKEEETRKMWRESRAISD